MKHTLKTILEYDNTQMKLIKESNPDLYALYQLYFRTFINNHSSVIEFKRKLSIKMYQENEQEIKRILTEKIQKKQDKNKQNNVQKQKLLLETKIQTLKDKLDELQQNHL